MRSLYMDILIAALLVAGFLSPAESQALAPCIEAVRCNADMISYRRHNANCGDAGTTRTCPATEQRCFGGNIGVAPAADTGFGAGPCVAAPSCTSPGGFHLILNGRRECRYFYTCTTSGTGTGFTVGTSGACNGAEEFNNSTLRCEPAATANCSIPLTTTPATSSSTETSSSSSTSSSSTSTTTTTITPSTTTSTARPTVPVCQGFGRLADPTSCRHFYMCGFLGRRTRRRCPFSKRFDINAGRCSQGADCGSRPLV